MNVYRAEALVLAAKDWGNSEKLITFFTKELGKITAVAYGARQPKSTLGGRLQLFSHVEVMLQPGRSIDTIKQCTSLQSFAELRNSITTIAYGSFIAELTSVLCAERQSDPAIFELLLAVQKLLPHKNPRIILLAASWQLLALAGFKPQIDFCVECGKNITASAEFAVKSGGIVCSACSESNSFTEDDFCFLKQLLALNFDQPDSFTVSGAVLMKAETILIQYINLHLEKQLKSLEFINSVLNTNL